LDSIEVVERNVFLKRQGIRKKMIGVFFEIKHFLGGLFAAD